MSAVFPGRDVPDIAGNADPETGYQVTVDGEDLVFGGTSAVAPLHLGLYLRELELAGGKAFNFVATVAANPTVCFDVTSGKNGGFRAGPGRDETTGFGVPDGTRLLTVLKGGGTVTPTPAPGGDTNADDMALAAAAEKWLKNKGFTA